MLLCPCCIIVECMFFAITRSIRKRLWTWTELDTVKQSTSIKINDTGFFFLYTFFKWRTFFSVYCFSLSVSQSYCWCEDLFLFCKNSECDCDIGCSGVEATRWVCCQCNVYFAKRPNKQLWVHILCWFMLMWHMSYCSCWIKNIFCLCLLIKA